jgi:hypothetical protein
VAERYLAALTDAEKLVKSQPEQMKALLMNDMHYTSTYVEYLWPKFDFRIWLSQEMLLSLENEERWTIANELTAPTEEPDFLHYIDFGPLSDVKPEAVNIIH